MAERIRARLGDTVETAFNLVYKRAEVARLPDRQRYEAIDFMMQCDVANKIVIGAGRQPAEGNVIVCAVREVTQDDQPVTAQWSFSSPSHDPAFFQAGEIWKLYLGYVSRENGTVEEPDKPGVHLLAEVELVGSDPAPAPGA